MGRELIDCKLSQHCFIHTCIICSPPFCSFLGPCFTDSRLVTFAFALALNLVPKNRLFYMLISNFGKKILQIGLGVGVPAVTTFALLSRPLSAMAASPSSIYDFTAKDIDGNDVSLSKYAGHVCIIVNVASK